MKKPDKKNLYQKRKEFYTEILEHYSKTHTVSETESFAKTTNKYVDFFDDSSFKEWKSITKRKGEELERGL